ncbi:Peroxisomal membrane anchor protein conserved region-domain-containing protein [Trichophyton interdigitale]|uniref:Peroxisomal membrane protein PEX14 n=1 Tax=Trichophyton interdigitale TaxID=101480 RepID=A0A9P5CWD5_9EURO|nr:Peroxisomal membrane anchor protein conserved region-domain-containing protein [Trichophyton interdigitale]KAF3897494.1 Peroxisomal membrane anchor protein conserved region-domain-containing protein [Trichophyton interdigitale]KAG8209833.1 Peroxisomal membrane anchor protein conserved region-domain-containing protein [Trichophyton interdigitale]
MAGPKDAAIPSWQQAASDNNSTATSSAAATESRETLLEQARRFLQDESISEASTDKKIAFLESKGLSNDEIHTLLGISRNTQASASASDDTGSNGLTEEQESQSKKETAGEASSQPTQSPAAASASPAPTSTASSSPSKDVPPIITYPEFLLRQSKPPLITFQNFLYTLYATAGIAASVYGASEYLAKPMLASLNCARHEFSETVQGNLKALNEKLEGSVSKVPASSTARPKGISMDNESEADNESVTSDPTELFHRDIATQTTDLELSAPSQTAVGTEAQTISPQSVIEEHHSRLQSLSSSLASVVTAEKYSDSTRGYAKDRLSELQTYLDSLTYSAPLYLSSALYGSYDDSADAKKAANGEDEAIAAFKAEIRSVKGTLLSARNFPSGSGGLRR